MTRDEYLTMLDTVPATGPQVGAVIAEFRRLGITGMIMLGQPGAGALAAAVRPAGAGMPPERARSNAEDQAVPGTAPEP